LQAYSQLAWTHDELYILGHDHTPARLAMAETATQAAFHLQPDAGEAHLARASNLYRGHLDYDGALAELETAHKSLPNDSRIFELKGYIQRRQGKHEAALRELQRAVELDPRNVSLLQQIALSYFNLRRYGEVESICDRILAIDPHDIQGKATRAATEVAWKADTRPLHQMIDSLRATNPGAIRQIADSWVGCALLERATADAEAALIAAGENTPINADAVHFPRSFAEGVIARLEKNEDKARAAFVSARAQQEKIVQAQPDYGPPLCVLGVIDAALGRKDDALREGRRAVELLPPEKDAINGPHMIEYLALSAAWVGEKDLACEQLATALQLYGSPSYGDLKLSPYWDPLRGDPRFEKIVASLAPKG
jgi:tetratricopeptide (TPR) repeat protein